MPVPHRAAAMGRAAALLLLALLLLTAGGCSRSERTAQQPMAQEVYDRLLKDLNHGEFLKIASHFNRKEEIEPYLAAYSDKLFHAGSSREGSSLYEDYRPANTGAVVGFTLDYDAETHLLKEIGVGIGRGKVQEAEALLALAVAKEHRRTEPPFLAKQRYSFGYIPMEGKRLVLNVEKSVLPDRAFYNFLYTVIRTDETTTSSATDR